MSRVIAAFTQFFDSAGDPLSNGFLRFTFSGTNNTDKNTYSNSSFTIANSNPVQLDAAGRCPDVFGQGVYRVNLYDYNEVTHSPGQLIASFDPVNAETATTSAGGNFAEWDNGTTYQIGNIVIYNGMYYRSLTDSNVGNAPDTSPGDWERIEFLRYWNTNATYQTDDIVVYGSQIYFSLADSNTSNQPDISPAWWDSIASGTILLNWEESGTIFQPKISGYDLGTAINSVGTAYIEDFGTFPLTPFTDPTNDYDVSNKQYADALAAARMNWIGDWVPATYEINDVVRDDNWTMIANTQTDERPAPQPVGDAEWVSDEFGTLTFSSDSSTSAVLYIGQRYTFDPGFLVKNVRVWVPTTALGLHIKIWAIYNPDTDPRFVSLYPGTTVDISRVNKWLELFIGDTYVEAGTIVDVIMVLRSPDEENTFSYDWSYEKANGDPPAGQIYHQGGSDIDQMRVHEQDNTATDRSTYLDNIGPGSKIYMTSSQYTWEVLSASKTGDVYTFTVDPGARAANAVSNFTFYWYGTSPIYYSYNTDYYISDARIKGYFATEYDGSNPAYINDDAYGIDIQVQTVTSSEYWDVVAQPQFGGSIGGGISLGYWEENSEYWQPKTTAVGYLGNTDKLIQGLYLGDNGTVYFGDDQDASMWWSGAALKIDTGGGGFDVDGNTAWTAGNDGTGSGLDADLLDGQHGSYYAVDTAVVHIVGTETITGDKDFTGALTQDSSSVLAVDDLSTDDTLSGDSDTTAVAESAVKGYVDGSISKATNDNVIINPIFQEWQRGTGAFTTSGGYTADRYRLAFVNTAASISQVAGTVINGETTTEYGLAYTFTTGTAAGDLAQLQQRIEDVEILHNCTVTVNIVANIPSGNEIAVSWFQDTDGGGTVNGTGVKLTGTGSVETYSLQLDIDEVTAGTIGANSYLLLNIWMDAGATWDGQTDTLGHQPSGTVTFYAIQVRPGVRDNIIEIPNKEDNLLRCLRYYWRISPVGSEQYVGSGSIATSGAAYAEINFTVPMRIAPSASVDAAASMAATDGGTSRISTSIGANTPTKESVLMIIYYTAYTNVGGGSVGRVRDGHWLDFDAEL